MRISPLVLALSLTGMVGTLEAAKPAHKMTAPQGLHRVRKGETAAKIARQFKLSLAQLEELNPAQDLAKLSVGTTLRVSSERKVAKLASTPVREVVPAKDLAPVQPLPATPSLRPSSLVHLERVLPSERLRPVPDGTNLSAAGSVDEPRSLAAQMQPVLPRPVAPEAAAPLSFDYADPAKLDLLWPVETRTISSAWGPRMRTRTVRVKTQASRKKIRQRYRGNHRGVDLTAPMGTDVYAALDGRVIESGRHKDYGNFVVLDHGNGVTTLYGHHKLNYVRTGDIVRRGQKIAEVGRTGKATGPHLHFELRIDGVHQNPLPMLNDVEEIPAELMALNEAAVPPRRARH
jgi:murein DD-endopeptidase MepM/ murein hydrolase activator NlpD